MFINIIKSLIGFSQQEFRPQNFFCAQNNTVLANYSYYSAFYDE